MALNAHGLIQLQFETRFLPLSYLLFIEWVEEAELICQLCKLKMSTAVIPLRLLGSLKQKKNPTLTEIKRALYTDLFVTYQQFLGHQLLPGETVDVYLADLLKLSVPFGDVNERMLGCVFVAGLPDDVSRLLRATSRMDELSTDQLLTQA